MAPVDVERVYAVFQRFAVSPVSSPAAGSSRSPAADALREAYIPTCFLTAAAREAGYYPAASTIQRFVKTVPSAAAGAVTFAAFLQLCEDVAHTNRPGRSAVYELVDDIDTRGSGIISRRELVHILTSGAPTITEGEVSAILQLLDPSNSGYVRLNDLATALIESCERQRSPRSRSRSAREHQAQQQALAARAHAEFERRQAAPSPSASGNGAAARRPHSRQSSAERVDPQLYTAPPQQQQPQRPRRVLRPRGFNAPRSPSPPAARDPQTPEKQRHRHHHHQPPHASGEGERDRSFKRTDIGSNGEVVVRPYSSTVSRADAFERTQTAMTVDVDVQPSTRQPTAMAAGRSRSRGFSKPSPSPGAASAGAAGGSTPPRQVNPAPGSAGSSPAAASSMRPPLPTVPPPPGTAAASESTTDEPRLRPGAAVSAEGNDAAGRASEQLEFSKAEPERWKAGVGGGGGGEAAAADGEEGDAARGAAAAPPPRPPAQKESGGKCCIVM